MSFILYFSQVCDTKQIIVSERDGETSLAYSVPLKSFEFKFQRAQQSMKLNVILRLLQVIIIIIPLANGNLILAHNQYSF